MDSRRHHLAHSAKLCHKAAELVEKARAEVKRARAAVEAARHIQSQTNALCDRVTAERLRGWRAAP